jgi:hypothetical protein
MKGKTMTKKQAKARCEQIARKTGAQLTWHHDGDYGYYIPGTNKIFCSDSGSVTSLITIFLHELSHYKNYLDGKYYNYHHLSGKKFMRKFKTKDALITYALKAEIYTDKRGKKLCAEYFPGFKFNRTYKFNKQFYNMMYYKYFGGYYIIVVNEKNAFIVKNNLTTGILYDSF